MKNERIFNYLMLVIFGLLVTTSCQQKPAVKEQQPTGKELFAKYYAMEESKKVDVSDLMPTRGDEVDPEAGRKDTLLKAVQLFNKGQYVESTKALKEYLEKYAEPVSDFERANFFYGLCQIEHGQFAEAINVFGQLNSSSNRDLAEKSRYYRALCYLVVDPVKAKGLFDEISKDNGSSYQDESKALLGIL